MRHYLSTMAILVLAALTLAGCEQPKRHEVNIGAKTIIGHCYRSGNASDYLDLYFETDYTCTLTRYSSDRNFTTSALRYVIDDNWVEVYADNSDEWESSARNQLMLYLHYLEDEDLLEQDGVYFKRLW